MNRNRTVWIVLLVVILVVCACGVLTAGAIVVSGFRVGNLWAWSRLAERTEESTQIVEVAAPANLTIDLPVGDVSIRVAEDDVVTVNATKRVWSSTEEEGQAILEEIAVSVDRTGNDVQVRVTGANSHANLPRAPRVDLAITVPARTSVSLDIDVGQVLVEGTSGDVRIRADVGLVALHDVLPTHTLEVSTRVAGIELTGALSPESQYGMSSDVGRITVRLPADSAFDLDARSDVGDIDLGFTLDGRSTREGIVGREMVGSVGEPGGSVLQLRSRVGAISVTPLR